VPKQHKDKGITWTDRTWNPVRGCSRISPGCVNCYAETIAARFSAGPEYSGWESGDKLETPAQPFHLYVARNKSGSKWTGKVDLIEDKLLEPLSWRKPCRVFVNSMSDLFHENLPDEAIDRVFAVMALTPHITYQVLTKRADRMQKYFEKTHQGCPDEQGRTLTLPKKLCIRDAMNALGKGFHLAPDWPLPNVWLGVSVEDQQRADERIPDLQATPAAVRFISQEPQLERIVHKSLDGIDWLIIGGESGPGARPFDIEWARSSIRQSREAGVAPFFKQAGARPYTEQVVNSGFSHFGVRKEQGKTLYGITPKDRKGGDMAEWPEDLRVREFPR